MRGDENGAVYGEVRSAWANRVQPANSKGGNWWQSPFCGAHTDRHFRESHVMRKHLMRGMKMGRGTARLAQRGQTGYSQPIPKAGIGGGPRFAARTPIGIFERVAL
jgi:hypothetical protein